MTYVDSLIALEPVARPARTSSPRQAASDPDLAPLLSVLFHTMDEVRSIVVNISSAQAGAGTSTVARRLAEAAAGTGWCRVALVDAHPHRGEPGQGMVERIERGQNPALIRCMAGTMEIHAGRLSTGAQLPRLDSVRRLYGALRDRFALVIVDCPAVLDGQQTLTIAPAADETVLVVEAERTALADVARARAALERRGAGVLGMVLNKSRKRSLFRGRT